MTTSMGHLLRLAADWSDEADTLAAEHENGSRDAHPLMADLDLELLGSNLLAVSSIASSVVREIEAVSADSVRGKALRAAEAHERRVTEMMETKADEPEPD